MPRYIKVTNTLTRDLDDSEFQRLVNEDLIVLNSDGTVDFVRPCIDEEIFHQDDIEYEDAEVIEFTTQTQE